MSAAIRPRIARVMLIGRMTASVGKRSRHNLFARNVKYKSYHVVGKIAYRNGAMLEESRDFAHAVHYKRVGDGVQSGALR